MAAKEVSSISVGNLVAYALPSFALAIPIIPAFVFLPAYYGTALGLSVAGFALFIARALDVIIDPIVGILSDRWSSRWGRRKPWIVLGALIGGVAIVQLFQPPSNVTPSYLIFWSVSLYFGWTLIQIPYTAWGAELSSNYNERTRITSTREGVSIIGILAAGAVPAIASNFGNTEQEAYAAISWLAVLVGGPLIAFMLWRVPDRAIPTTSTNRDEVSGSFFEECRRLLANRPFVRLLSAWFINGLATGIPASLFLLYLEHALQASTTERSALTLVYFLAAVIAIPGWLIVSRIVGKHRAWCVAMIAACLAFVWVPLLGPGDILAFGVICLITGMSLGADLSLPPALQADVVDYDTLRSGRHRAGIFFALWGMSTKLAFAFAVGIALPSLAFFGFNTDGENDARAILAISVGYALVPVILKVAAIYLIWGFPITASRHLIIRQRLDSLASRITGAPSQYGAE